MDIEELKARKKALEEKTASNFAEVDKIIDETARVQMVAANAEDIISNIDREFEKITALNNTDVAFMLFAAMLQSMRWILMPELRATEAL